MVGGLNLEQLWCPQRSDWSCGLAALRTALRYYGLDIGERALAASMRGMGLKIFDWGVYLPYLALAARNIGFRPRLRMTLDSLGEMRVYKDKSLGEASGYLAKRIGLRDRRFLYKSLRLCLDCSCDVKLYKSSKLPGFKHVREALSEGVPVIVLVSCKDYYGIDEGWNHTLTLIPLGKGFKVFDPYVQRGRRDYKDWDIYLSKAANFNWEKWSGDMLELHK